MKMLIREKIVRLQTRGMLDGSRKSSTRNKTSAAGAAIPQTGKLNASKCMPILLTAVL